MTLTEKRSILAYHVARLNASLTLAESRGEHIRAAQLRRTLADLATLAESLPSYTYAGGRWQVEMI